jgi:broad specificity phosphatase PhoE
MQERAGVKRLVLVRHAESQNNVDKREAKRGLKALFIAPKKEDWQRLRRLASVPMNSALSPEGERMVDVQRDALERDDFLARHQIELIVHSHLLRAKLTAQGLFGNLASGHVGSKTSVTPLVEHPLLFEQNVKETLLDKTSLLGDVLKRTLHVSSMEDRIKQVTAWLFARPETTILIVGHSAFFRSMLGPALVDGVAPHPDNCDVWYTQLHEDGSCADTRLLVHGGRSLLAQPADPARVPSASLLEM